MVNLTTPSKMKSNETDVEEVLIKFEEKFLEEERNSDFYHLILRGEYNRDICDEIERNYSEAGWGRVNCRTSSENGERPGLTGLMLWSTSK